MHVYVCMYVVCIYMYVCYMYICIVHHIYGGMTCACFALLACVDNRERKFL